MNDITSYMLEQTKKILSIDSPTGFTAHAAEYVLGAYKKLGYDAKLTNKGGIFVCVNDGPDRGGRSCGRTDFAGSAHGYPGRYGLQHQ